MSCPDGVSPAQAPLYVAVHLRDGLGNQLFQYAAGRGLASRLGARLVLDPAHLRRRRSHRRFALDRYPIDATVARKGYVKLPEGRDVPLPASTSLRTDVSRFLRSLLRRMGANAGNGELCRPRLSVFTERDFNYDPRIESLTGSTYLVGWFQSPRYFEHVAGVIRSELRLPTPPAGANRSWLDRIRQSNSVCLHVRRGDYLSARELPNHGSCSAAYYMKAKSCLEGILENPQFFLFSDDWRWSHENFRGDNLHLVDANGPEAAADELRLMSACRHHIIANSSFSWWGAWLARHDDQVVIAPDPWFNVPPVAPDLLPAQWLRMPRD